MKNKLILDSKYITDKLGPKYQNISNIFSDKFGIINAILKRKELSKYNLYMYQCLSANAVELFDLSREVSSGGLGVNENENVALLSCIAEAVERYCMSFVKKDDIIFSYKKDLDERHVFKKFHLYTDEQYKINQEFLNPNKDKIHWVKINSVDSKNWMYWPASLIYLPFDLSKPVAETTSTGMAAGLSIDDCVKSGLLELIERDSLMINFMQELNPPELEVDTISGCNIELIKSIKKKYKIHIYKLYNDLNVPSYFSIIYTKRLGKIHYGIGACSHFDSDIAINKSLKECLFTYFYSKNIMDLRKTNPDEIKTLYEHFLYYQRENFKYLLFNSEKISYQKEKISYKELLKKLKNKNMEVYYKELTTSDIKDTKLKVVKVVVPGLIDLNKSHIYQRLDAERFWTVPRELNLKCDKLSSKPHPFP